MKAWKFKFALDALRNNSSRTTKKHIVRFFEDEPAAISFLAGSEFDDAGLGKKTVLSVAREVFPEVSGKPTVSESLEQYDNYTWTIPLDCLHRDMQHLARISGNDQKQALKWMFELYPQPSVVTHACLNDWPTGVSDSTVASALGIKESLPFYDGVHEAAKDIDPTGETAPRTTPTTGLPFAPMLAAPERRKPDDLTGWVAEEKVDGYRILIHKGQTFEEFEADEYPDEEPVRAFSRRKNEVTASLPELENVGLQGLSGYYILDGEVIASDGTYSTTSSRVGKKRENIDDDTEMHFVLFDVVVFRGTHVANEPYHERRHLLQKVVDALDDDRVRLSRQWRDHDEAEVAIRSEGGEGIIIKDSNAPYQYGKRSKYWVKCKYDAETIDANVTNYAEGEGKASGSLGKVLLQSSDDVTLGWMGSGFSDEQREYYWENPDELLGSVFEVEARGIGSQNRLRQPIFKRDRSDDGEADSWERVQEVMKDV